MAVAVIATTVLGLEESWGMGGCVCVCDTESKAIGTVMCLLGGKEDADNG